MLQTDTGSAKPGPGSDAKEKTWPRELLLSRKPEFPVASQVIWELAQTCLPLLNNNRNTESSLWWQTGKFQQPHAKFREPTPPWERARSSAGSSRRVCTSWGG